MHHIKTLDSVDLDIKSDDSAALMRKVSQIGDLKIKQRSEVKFV